MKKKFIYSCAVIIVIVFIMSGCGGNGSGALPETGNNSATQSPLSGEPGVMIKIVWPGGGGISGSELEGSLIQNSVSHIILNISYSGKTEQPADWIDKVIQRPPDSNVAVSSFFFPAPSGTYLTVTAVGYTPAGVRICHRSKVVLVGDNPTLLSLILGISVYDGLMYYPLAPVPASLGDEIRWSNNSHNTFTVTLKDPGGSVVTNGTSPSLNRTDEWSCTIPKPGPVGNYTYEITPPSIPGGFVAHNGHYYGLTSAKTWSQAEAEARTYGAHLVTINDSAENAWLLSQFGDNNYWTGYYQISTLSEPSGGWTWASIDTPDPSYTNWDAGKPDNSGGSENYCSIKSGTSGKWDDVAGTNTYQGIIEFNNVVTGTIAVSDSIPPLPDMAMIKGGTYQMGIGIYTPHQVTLSDFYMGKYEVTNKEFNLSGIAHTASWPDPNYPVENVSWYDAVAYCNWLSQQHGLTPCYGSNPDTEDPNNWLQKNGYRLPTEAEWEYACRAGTTTDYYWGTGTIDNYCIYSVNSGNHPSVVGNKLPNAFGLYDMSGNIREWCGDWYNNYPASPQINPPGPPSGPFRVIRGGYWGYDADYCRSSNRNFDNPVNRFVNLGFRLVRNGDGGGADVILLKK